MAHEMIKFLRNSREINSARKLLYSVYIKEMKWTFHPQNPTGFNVKQLINGEKMLCDVFDSDALWVGAFKDEELAGTARILTRRNKLGKLDLELYDSKRMPSLAKIYTPCIEFQRFGVKKEYRGTRKLGLALGFFAMGYAKKLDVGVCSTASSRYLEELMFKCGFEYLEREFYYGEGREEKPASVLFCPSHKVTYTIEKAKGLKMDGKNDVTLQL